jgi:hypothetical protein
MRIVVSGATEHVRTFEGFVPPVGCTEILFDDGDYRCASTKFANTFLGSSINCLVTIRECPPLTNMAGVFANCLELTVPPVLESTQWCKGMAALYKGCESLTRVNVLKTQRVTDMRQMYQGCTNLTGKGVRVDCPAVRSPDGMSNFASGCNFERDHYSRLIEQLHFQMRAGTLPTPMTNVNFGTSTYHPWLAEKRQKLIDYGWQIRDGGTDSIEPLGPWPARWSFGVDSRIKDGTLNLSGVRFGSRFIGAKNGVLVAPQWALFVQHWPPSVGEGFTLASGERVRVASVVHHPQNDLTLARLQEPAKTLPARVMSFNGAAKVPYMLDSQTLGKVAHIPVLVIDRRNAPRVLDYQGVSVTGAIAAERCDKPPRASLSGGFTVGDSGSPGWLLDDSAEPTLIYLVASPGGGGHTTFGAANWSWLASQIGDGFIREWSPA